MTGEPGQGREPLEKEAETVDEAEEAQLQAGDMEELLEEDEEASAETFDGEPKEVEEVLEEKA